MFIGNGGCQQSTISHNVRMGETNIATKLKPILTVFERDHIGLCTLRKFLMNFLPINKHIPAEFFYCEFFQILIQHHIFLLVHRK